MPLKYFGWKIAISPTRVICGAQIKGGEFYDTLGAEVPKIAFSQLWPQLLMDRADFWHGDSFLVELHLKLAIFPFGPPPLPPAPP